MLNTVLRKWSIGESEFVRNVITLATGTGLAQAIPMLAAPLVTRLYTPSDYGILTLYSTIIGLAGIFANGMYASAIVIAKNDDDATNVFALSILITLVFSVVGMGIVFLLHDAILSWLGEPRIWMWVFLMPLSIFLSSLYQAQNNWVNRNQKFKILAGNRISQAIFSTGIQLLFGFVQLGASGLISTVVLANLFATALLSWRVWRNCPLNFRVISFKKMRWQAKEHWRFPIYSLPTDFLNIAVNRAPIFMLNMFAGVAAIGYYGFALRIMTLPTGLLSASIGDVFRQRASSDYREHGNCRSIYLKTFKSLSLMAALPFLFLFIAAPTIFPLIFGAKWAEAGDYMRWLSIMSFAGFVSSPLSYVYYIAEKQGEDLLLHLYMLVSTILCMYVGFWIFGKITYVIALFSINYALIYVIYLIRSYSFANGLGKMEQSVTS